MCDHLTVAPPPRAAFFTADVGPLSVRWERHTEVCVHVGRALAAGRPGRRASVHESHAATSSSPRRGRGDARGIMSATHVALVEGDPADGWGDEGGPFDAASRRVSEADDESAAEIETAALRRETAGAALLRRVKPLHRGEVITGSTLDRGRFRAYSDWRVHADGSRASRSTATTTAARCRQRDEEGDAARDRAR